MNHSYIDINNAVFNKTKRAVSPLKFAQSISQTVTLAIRTSKWQFTSLQFIAYYDSYEKRKKRRNIADMIADIQAVTP